MTLLDYMRVLRRRWALVAGITVLVAALALLTAPQPAHRAPGVSTAGYRATATLLQDPNATSSLDLPPHRALHQDRANPAGGGEGGQLCGQPVGAV